MAPRSALKRIAHRQLHRWLPYLLPLQSAMPRGPLDVPWFQIPPSQVHTRQFSTRHSHLPRVMVTGPSVGLNHQTAQQSVARLQAETASHLTQSMAVLANSADNVRGTTPTMHKSSAAPIRIARESIALLHTPRSAYALAGAALAHRRQLTQPIRLGIRYMQISSI